MTDDKIDKNQRTYTFDGIQKLVPCKHSKYTFATAERTPGKYNVACSLGLFNGKPQITDCHVCERYEPLLNELIENNPSGAYNPSEEEEKAMREANYKGKSRGLGDTIAKATRAVGIKPCGACKKRQAKLNKMFSYKSNKEKGGCKECKKPQKEEGK